MTDVPTASAGTGAANAPEASAVPQVREFGQRTGETVSELYLRQIRGAVTFIAWIVGIAAVISVICGIVVAVQISHLNSAVNGGGSNCVSQGGTNLNC